MNPAEWTPDQWWDVIKTAVGLILSGIVIPFARKAVKEAREAKQAAQRTESQTATQQRVNGDLRTVSNATQLEQVVRTQDQIQATQAAMSDLVLALVRDSALQRGPGARRINTEEVPAWNALQSAGKPSLEPSSPAPVSPSSPSPTTEESTPSSGSSSASPPSPAAEPSGPFLTRSVPLPDRSGN